jgi:hypothetical protein
MKYQELTENPVTTNDIMALSFGLSGTLFAMLTMRKLSSTHNSRDIRSTANLGIGTQDIEMQPLTHNSNDTRLYLKLSNWYYGYFGGELGTLESYVGYTK